MEKKTQVSVNTDVIEKVAEMAACEIEGVKGLAKKSVDLKNALKAKNVVKAVKIESINGALELSIYITVYSNVKVRDIAEAVQKNVKDRIQTMTNSAVTRVNVNVADIDFEEAE